MSPSRLYLPSSGAAPISPAFAAEWESVNTTRRLAVTTKISSSIALTSQADATATSNRDIGVVQYVSNSIASGPLSGTVKGQISVRQDGSGENLRSQIIIRVVSNDGSVVRGTLYAGDLTTGTGDPTSEWSTIATNRRFPRDAPVALATVGVQDGDRVVIELGARKHAATSVTAELRLGDNSGSDLPDNETSTSTYNPWIEFSDDLFTPRGASVRAWILE